MPNPHNGFPECDGGIANDCGCSRYVPETYEEENQDSLLVRLNRIQKHTNMPLSTKGTMTATIATLVFAVDYILEHTDAVFG